MTTRSRPRSPHPDACGAVSADGGTPHAPTTAQEIIDREDAVGQQASATEGTSRFASTGDPKVDRALAELPDPDEHRRDDELSTGRSDDQGSNDSASGIDLPDPGLLDAHLAEVTSVHRQLQQRLSDLSG
ncbi:hypothetical protein [Flexivirga alba]|uniref:Uncharacterized protein n=1 Tax=Flexivirga alba TaxID=702742 RepID=A0ABW2AKD2_9MICO